MRRLFFLALLASLAIWACTPKDQQILSGQQVSLRFSEDTIMFDTLLSSRGSITKRFKVFNDEGKAVFTQVKLGGLAASQYKIWVNGVENYQHEDVLIFGKDSMLVLVEVEIDPQDETLPYLVKDSVVFSTNGKKQDVKLVAYGQDAHFLKDSVLACNTTWTAGKPYVILDSVTVPLGCNLTIEQGVKVLFNYKAKMKIEGNISVDGTATDKVYFCNDNDLSKSPEKALGYWSGLEFLGTSTGNTLDWVVMKNAEKGLYMHAGNTVDSSFEITLNHAVIKNMSKAGIEAYSLDMNISNSVVTNCANYLIGGFGGGNYNLIHNTLANSSFDFFRTGPSLQFNDNDSDEGVTVMNTLKVGIANSIVWGNLTEELSIEDATQFYNAYSLFKTSQTLTGEGNVYNASPDFVSERDNDLQLRETSVAIDTASDIIALPIDLNGVARDSEPEMGAYEYRP